MNLTKKFFLTLAGLIVIASLATLIITETVSKDIMKEQIQQKLEINTISRADHIETVLREYILYTETLAVGNSVIDAFDEDIDYTQRMENLNKKINKTIESRSNIYAIMVINRNGTVIASSVANIGYDKSTDLLFIEGKNNSCISDILICQICGQPVIGTATPIFLDDEFIGVCFVFYSAASDLYRITTDTTGLGETGEIYLVNKDGYMISPSRFANGTILVTQLHNIGGFDLHEISTSAHRNYLGTNVLRDNFHITEMEWCLIAEISEEEAYSPITKLNDSIKYAVLLFIILGFTAAFIMSRTVTKPISDLINGVREMRRGNLDQMIDIKTGDEIELFAHEFNQMSTELKNSYSNLEKQVDKRTQEYQNAYNQLEIEITEHKKTEEQLKDKQVIEKAYADILTVTNKSADMDDLVTAGLNRLMKYTNSPLGIIYLYNPQRNVLVPKAAQGTDKTVMDREFSTGEGIPGETAQKKKMVVVTDIPEDTIFRIESGLCEITPGTIVSTPMIFKQMLLGVVLTCHTGKVSSDMQAFIQRVVDQYAVSVNNANTFAQTQEMALELKNQRDELEIQSHELEAASKTKSEFLANMSHELRTPLNSIIGFSEILHDQTFGPANEKQMKYLNNVLTSGKHLLALINDILDLSKVEAGKVELIYEEFEISSTINEVRTLVTSVAFKKNITIDVAIAPELTLINADIGKLKQILFNLLSNAIKFSPDNATVTVDARRTEDMALISVADKGIGISKQDQEKLFNSFVQIDSSTSRQYDGTGLGLVLVRRFVELHGGKIWVESEPENGSTFFFTIPISGEIKVINKKEPEVEPESVKEPEISQTINPEDPEKTGISGIIEPDNPTKDEHLILVIEDDKKSNELLTLTLTGAGYSVISAYTGKQAIEVARKHRLFAITLDIMLPGMDGWGVLKCLKGDPATRDIPVIVVSMVDDKEIGYSLGIVDYFIKPVKKEVLLATLDNLTTKLDVESTRVLIVDDEPAAVEMIASMIEPAGYGVIRAYNGQQGIDMTISEHPDLMILDLMMPVINGFDVITSLKSNPGTRDIPIIVCTAKDLTRDEIQMLTHNVVSIMQKGTFNSKRFIDEIKRITMS